MTRVRGFTQDDAHLFCTEEQVAEEFRGCIEMTKYVLKCLGLDNYRAILTDDPVFWRAGAYDLTLNANVSGLASLVAAGVLKAHSTGSIGSAALDANTFDLITHTGGQDFKVQDGLVVEMIRPGDRVEVTVENIGGAETVVGAIKE